MRFQLVLAGLRPERFGNAASSLGTGGGSGIDPATLFANGESGDYWQAYDLAGTLDATVQTWAGKRGQNDFTQATAGSRPVLKARGDGVRYLDFAAGKSMSVSSSTALFKYLHDGTGGTVLALVDWPAGASSSTMLRNCTASTQVGFYLAKVSSNQSLNWVTERGQSGTHVVNSTSLGWAAGWAGRWQMISHRYKNDGGADDFIGGINGGRTKFVAATLAAPSSAAAASNLTLDTTFGGVVYALLVISRKLTDDEVAGVYAYWKARIDEAVPSPSLTILIGGQSNASGRGAIDGTPPTTAAGAWMLDRAEEYRRLYEPSHNIINQPVATVPAEPARPGLSFATYLANDLVGAGLVPLIVPAAVGSTGIDQWDHPESAGDRATLFGAAVYRMKKALAEKGGSPVIVWYGHEAGTGLITPDYVNGGVGPAYRTAFETLFAHLRAEIGAAPIVFVQLSSGDELALAENQMLKGEAQRQAELTIPNAAMVVAHDIQRNPAPDDQHVAKQGYAVLGPRIALAIRQHVLGEPVNGTGPRIVGATYSGATVTLACDKPINSSAGNYGNLFRVYDNGVEATVSSANRNGGDTSRIDIVCSAPLTGPVTLTYGARAGLASAPRTDFVADADGLPLPVFGPVLVNP